MKKKIVKVGNISCGTDDLFVISGPCVIEDELIMMKTAEKLKEVSARLKVPIIYKSSFQKDNRSSAKYYDGPGLDKGVKLLAKIKEQFGFPLLTDIHYPDQAAAAGQVVDVLQIPAYLCMQTTLVRFKVRSWQRPKPPYIATHERSRLCGRDFAIRSCVCGRKDCMTRGHSTLSCRAARSRGCSASKPV